MKEIIMTIVLVVLVVLAGVQAYELGQLKGTSSAPITGAAVVQQQQVQQAPPQASSGMVGGC